MRRCPSRPLCNLQALPPASARWERISSARTNDDPFGTALGCERSSLCPRLGPRRRVCGRRERRFLRRRPRHRSLHTKHDARAHPRASDPPRREAVASVRRPCALPVSREDPRWFNAQRRAALSNRALRARDDVFTHRSGMGSHVFCVILGMLFAEHRDLIFWMQDARDAP